MPTTSTGEQKEGIALYSWDRRRIRMAVWGAAVIGGVAVAILGTGRSDAFNVIVERWTGIGIGRGASPHGVGMVSRACRLIIVIMGGLLLTRGVLGVAQETIFRRVRQLRAGVAHVQSRTHGKQDR